MPSCGDGRERFAPIRDESAHSEAFARVRTRGKPQPARLSRSGYELRAVGLQPEAAEYGGVNVGRTLMRAMILSGAIAGLGGVNYVLGYKQYYEEGFTGGVVFLGIAVALVGRNHPVGVLLAALFFATLSQGGLAIHAFVPKQMVEVLQGVVILAVAMSVPEVRAALRKARKPVAA